MADSVGHGERSDAGADKPHLDDEGSPGSPEFFYSWFQNGKYKKTPVFTKVTSAPYASTAVAGAKIEIYVTASSYADYMKISPDRTGSGVTIPPTMIVREVLDASGKVTSLTVMARGLAGYNPSLGDWYFGVFDPKGNVLNGDDGTPQSGKLSACYSCHIPRANDAYLFGVPEEARAQPFAPANE